MSSTTDIANPLPLGAERTSKVTHPLSDINQPSTRSGVYYIYLLVDGRTLYKIIDNISIKKGLQETGVVYDNHNIEGKRKACPQ